MRRFLSLTLNFIILIVSCFTSGCKTESNQDQIPHKTYQEYYEILLNSTIEMELTINNKKATCFYGNDSNIYVYTIKYQHSTEFGFIYDSNKEILYSFENKNISIRKENILLDEIIENVFKYANFFIYINHDTSGYEYKNTVTVCNRKCDKYRFVDELNGEEATFNVYIDRETTLCLKATCTTESGFNLLFETKKFNYVPSIDYYKTCIDSFNYSNK